MTSTVTMMQAIGQSMPLEDRTSLAHLSPAEAFKLVLTWTTPEEAKRRVICALHARQQQLLERGDTDPARSPGQRKAAVPSFARSPCTKPSKSSSKASTSSAEDALTKAQRRLLQNLQNREITPEDYDLLLLLDETIEKKEVDRSILSRILREEPAGDDVTCSICLGEIEVGKSASFLPCQHAFHKECVEGWLLRKPKCPMCSLEFD